MISNRTRRFEQNKTFEAPNFFPEGSEESDDFELRSICRFEQNETFEAPNFFSEGSEESESEGSARPTRRERPRQGQRPLDKAAIIASKASDVGESQN
jgi:hypothetical protein